MTDVFDIASENEERYTEKARQFRKPEGPKATGKCLWCGEELEDGRRWCDFSCMSYWERAKKVNSSCQLQKVHQPL